MHRECHIFSHYYALVHIPDFTAITLDRGCDYRSEAKCMPMVPIALLIDDSRPLVPRQSN